MKKQLSPFVASPALKRKKLKEALKLLNRIVCVRIGPSAIHGVGVVAIRDLKKGEKLELDAIPHQFDVSYKSLGELNQEIREILLGHFPQIVNGSHFLYPVTKFTAFLNHSEEPNYDGKKDIALVDIKKGEELTEDYRLIPNYTKVYKFIK